MVKFIFALSYAGRLTSCPLLSRPRVLVLVLVLVLALVLALVLICLTDSVSQTKMCRNFPFCAVFAARRVIGSGSALSSYATGAGNRATLCESARWKNKLTALSAANTVT